MPEADGSSRAQIALLFATRALRTFAYGLASVVLVLHLSRAGIPQAGIGLLLTLTLLGDTGISLLLHPRRSLGRRRTLVAGAGLMVLAALAFATTRSFFLFLLGATVGVLSPSGPLSGRGAGRPVPEDPPGLAHRRLRLVPAHRIARQRCRIALCGGTLVEALERAGLTALESYRGVPLRTAWPASPSRPSSCACRRKWRLPSRGVVFRLSALFGVDAFAGGLVVQSYLAFWFHQRFGASPAALGAIFFGANGLAGVSALYAAAIARRIGLVNTMVATHLPSSVLLALVPLMPTLGLAIGVLLLRFSISQMDVPTRQSYTMAVVEPDERSAAAGVTGTVRTVGAALAPLLAGPLYATAALSSLPFLLAGGLKAAYDLALWRRFRTILPPEERPVA